MTPAQYPNLLRGLLYGTVDAGAVQDALQRGWKVALVAETQPIHHPNCFMLSSLLPIPQCYDAYLNGRPDIGRQMYLQFLASKQEDEVVAMVVGALRKSNINLLLYVEPDPNKEFCILDTLAQFFAEMFGIVMGQYNHADMPAASYPSLPHNYNISDCLFRNGVISKEEYAFTLPPEAVPSSQSCALLLQSVNYGFPNLEAVLKVCCQMLHDIRENANTNKISPITILSEKDIEDRKAAIEKTVAESKTRFGNQN